MDIGRGVSHNGVCWWVPGGQWGIGSWGGITCGEMPDKDDGDGGSKPHCHVGSYVAILQVLHMYPRMQSAIKKKNLLKIKKENR